MIINAIFHKVFLTLKGYSAISVLWVSQAYIFLSKYICQFHSLDFHIISGGFHCLPGRKFSLKSHLKKFDIFPCQLSSPHQGAEAGFSGVVNFYSGLKFRNDIQLKKAGFFSDLWECKLKSKKENCHKYEP